MYEEPDGLSLRALAEIGQAHRRLRSATISTLPKVLAEAVQALLQTSPVRVLAVRGDRLVPLFAAPAADLGSPCQIEDSGFADVVQSAKARLVAGELPDSTPGAIAPISVGGDVTALLQVGNRRLNAQDLEVLGQLCDTTGARLGELEATGSAHRHLQELRERLSLLEGDPSRGRRRGDEMQQVLSTGDRAGGTRLQDLASDLPFGLLTARFEDGAWKVVCANDLMASMLGTPTKEVLGPLDKVLNTGSGVPPVDPSALLSREPNQPLRADLVRADGSEFAAWIYGLGRLDTHPTVAIGVLDVTHQRRRLRELERMAMTDSITGLANRTRATEVLDECLRTDPPGTVAVMLLDLDRFKNVNDSLGHATGDLLLVEVTQRLRAFVPPRTVVARLGGDEFLLVLRGLEDILDVHPLAYGLLENLAEPYDLTSGHRVSSSVSIGISIVNGPTKSATDVIREADLAMYRAKDLGRNRYAVCDASMLEAADERLKREGVLRRGLDEGRLTLKLQPIVDLATGRLVEFEALVRMSDEDRGEVPPNEFIPIAEETGLISQIDYWVIEEALSLFTRDHRLRDDPDVRIAVNISGRTLERMDFMSRLVVSLNKYQLTADRLVVEITESWLLGDNRAILWTLKQLRERGAAVAIDDFGTGYSSLSYLQSFKVDVLKIDQSFISRISDEEGGDRMVANIVRLAHDLGLHVVAEGVEETDQADVLRGLNCDLAQGWLFGRPTAPQIAPVES